MSTSTKHEKVSSWSEQVEQQLAGLLPELVAFRRDLHAHPELSFKEFETARKVRERLARWPGITVLPPIMQTDVVALLNADRPGPCLAIRADLDALPIQEASESAEVPYRSQVPNVMHACGHDGHTATALGAAAVLARLADQLPGKIKFIFQPGEEEGGGAETLCAKGVMTNPGVDGIVALHGWPARPAGMISFRPGPAMAANSCFDLIVRGRAAHGAYPHRGIDTVVVAAHIITAVQTIVARTVNPLDAAVATIGSLHAGAASNVIPDECHMKGTLRFLRPEVGEHLRARLVDIAEHTARAHGATAEVRFEKGYPPVINEERMTRLVEHAARDLFGDAMVFTDEPPSLGVEDFSYYGFHAPAMMFRLGVCPAGRDSYPSLHQPTYNFNDDALPHGVRLFCEVAQRFLAHGLSVR